MDKIWWRLALTVWVVGVTLALVLALGRCQGEEPAEKAQPVLVRPVVQVEEITCTHEAWSVCREDAEILARVAAREGGRNRTEYAAVMWCVLNRLEDPRFAYCGYQSVADAATDPEQFAWDPDTPLREELVELAVDVLTRWELERCGLLVDSGRVLPADYCWISGDGVKNTFRNEYRGGQAWDWSLPSPYGEV